MKTVTICGSMKFVNEMKKISWELECNHNFNVIQCVYNDEDEEITQKIIEKLASAHYKKIDLSDAIYVVEY